MLAILQYKFFQFCLHLNLFKLFSLMFLYYHSFIVITWPFNNKFYYIIVIALTPLCLHYFFIIFVGLFKYFVLRHFHEYAREQRICIQPRHSRGSSCKRRLKRGRGSLLRSLSKEPDCNSLCYYTRSLNPPCSV